MKKIIGKIGLRAALTYGVLTKSVLVAMAQPNISNIKTQVTTATSGVRDIVNIILGAVCLLGLIWVIYAVATSHPKARESAIGWFVALILWGIAYAIL